MFKVLTITGENKYVTISRSNYKLSDGYNYYLTLFTTGCFGNQFVINDSFQQTEKITSLKTAHETAIVVLNAYPVS